MKSSVLTGRTTKNKKLDVRFNGERLTSDAGAILLQKINQKLQLSECINQIIHDPRDPRLTIHQQSDLIAQRIVSIALGHDDVNDQKDLRRDSAMLAAIKNDTNEEFPLGSPSTLSRITNYKLRMKFKNNGVNS